MKWVMRSVVGAIAAGGTEAAGAVPSPLLTEGQLNRRMGGKQRTWPTGWRAGLTAEPERLASCCGLIFRSIISLIRTQYILNHTTTVSATCPPAARASCRSSCMTVGIAAKPAPRAIGGCRGSVSQREQEMNEASACCARAKPTRWQRP